MPGYKKRKSKKKRRVFILLILLVLILAYILLFSPLFKIQAVEIFGNREVETEEIKNNFNYGNIFLNTEEKIKNDLIKKIPKISDLEIKKDLIKRTIKLEIQERKEIGIVCQISEQRTGNNEQFEECFYIDGQGIIFEEAPQTSGSLILLIKDYSQRDYYLGKKVFEEGLINFISETREGLSSEIGLRVLEFEILFYPTNELKVVTSEGWYILFDLERHFKNQLLGLKTALEEKIQNRETLEYVDLRIENRIYYK